MKIILIHQAASAAEPAEKYDSSSFEEAVQRELKSGIAPSAAEQSDASAYRIYTGTFPAAGQTAEALFGAGCVSEETPLLDDVVPKAFTETDREYPLWVWRSMARLQWQLGNPRQPENRKTTLIRANRLIDRLEEDEKDCVIISGGLMLKTLLTALYKRGYCIEGGSGRLEPLARVRATKKDLHCGGCLHNCMLSNPGCGVGKEKARNAYGDEKFSGLPLRKAQRR